MKSDPGRGFEVGIVGAQPAVNKPSAICLPSPPLSGRVRCCHKVEALVFLAARLLLLAGPSQVDQSSQRKLVAYRDRAMTELFADERAPISFR